MIIENYNLNWPFLYEEEAKSLKASLGNSLEAIYHIGSTSIPGMAAKPVIDIMLSIDNLDELELIKEKLAELNYAPLNRSFIPHLSFFTSRIDKTITYHLHLHERGSPQINRHVNFRDYLKSHPKEANEYSLLKLKLASQFKDDKDAYFAGKTKLVQAIDAKAKLWLGRKKDFTLANQGLMAKDWSQDKLAKAMEANLNVHMTHFAQYLNQVELIRKPGFTLVNSHLADDTFNYVIDADFNAHNADAYINEVTDYFKQKNCPFSWWVSPQDKPANLPALLENMGYQNTESNCAMYFDLDACDGTISDMPSLEIKRAKDEKTLQDFALILTNDERAFKDYFSWIATVITEEDPIEYYVGYVNGRPVVRGLSCYFGQVVSLHWLSTNPSERNKGYGRAMQQYRLKRAKDLGYHIAVLQASREGYSLYKQLGYKECGYFHEFKN